MTGYGKAHTTCRNKRYEISIKTLNSKQIDIALHSPAILRDLDQPIRKLLTERIGRGRIDFNILLTQVTDEEVVANTYFDTELLSEVLQEVREIAAKINCDEADPLLLRLLTLPNMIQSSAKDHKEPDLTEDEIKQCLSDISRALDAVDIFRRQEGEMLEKILLDNVESIEKKAQTITEIAPQRIDNKRKKLAEELSKLPSSIEHDQNRFEQELIYYIEKLDVAEELVRLDHHIHYFRETIQQAIFPSGCGKKLSFIAQEMGREINTLGSKSNDATMQRLVVDMKDILEQIKEQIANVL